MWEKVQTSPVPQRAPRPRSRLLCLSLTLPGPFRAPASIRRDVTCTWSASAVAQEKAGTQDARAWATNAAFLMRGKGKRGAVEDGRMGGALPAMVASHWLLSLLPLFRLAAGLLKGPSPLSQYLAALGRKRRRSQWEQLLGRGQSTLRLPGRQLVW